MDWMFMFPQNSYAETWTLSVAVVWSDRITVLEEEILTPLSIVVCAQRGDHVS